MKFIDDKNKKLTWWTRNYFYLGTILFVFLCIFIHAVFGNHNFRPWICEVEDDYLWGKVLFFNNLLQGCINVVFHTNWQHCLLNMLCFFICGFYIERKTGTFNFILLTIAAVLIESALTTANCMLLNYAGASGMQFFFYGYIIVDYIFSFQKEKKNKTNIILGAIILGIIYVCMCFCGGTSSFEFKVYPYDLLYNMGHYSAFIGGIVIGLIIQLSQKKALLGSTINYETELSEKQTSIYKRVYIVALVLVTGLCCLCGTFYGITTTRTNLNVDVVCNYSEFNKSYVLNCKNDLRLGHLFNSWIGDNVMPDKDDYIFEIYSDINYKNKITIEYLVNYRLNGGPFIPLSKSTTSKFYINISKAYDVQFVNFGEYCYALESVKDYYDCTGGKSSKAKQNCDYSFKIYPKTYALKVYNNGVELISSGNYVYTIPNVNADVNITFSF